VITVLCSVVEHKIVKHMELFAPENLVCTKPQNTTSDYKKIQVTVIKHTLKIRRNRTMDNMHITNQFSYPSYADRFRTQVLKTQRINPINSTKQNLVLKLG